MRTVYLLLGVLLLGLEGWRANAQNYRPFGPQRTYHYQTAGTPAHLHTFRVDSVYAAGSDSIFCFNRTNGYLASVGGGQSYPRPMSRRNVFGGFQRWSAATGEAVFTAADTTAAVRLLTQAAVGQSWAFTPAVQATLVSRQAGQLLGQPDTVLTIHLSDGMTIQLARRYGLLAGPGFDYYLGRSYEPSLVQRPFVLAGVPELALGTADLRWSSIWDLRPGDDLYYQASSTGEIATPGGTSARSRYRLRILGRQLNATGDSLRFTADRTEMQDLFSAIYWSGTQQTRYAHQPLHRFTVPLEGATPMLTAVPNENQGAAFFPSGSWPAVLHPDTLDNHATFGNRFYFEGGSTVRYAAGLGQVYEHRYWMDDPTIPGSGHHVSYRLTGFVKNGHAWGDTAAIVLGTPPPRQLVPVTLLPNPSESTDRPPLLTCSLDEPQVVTLALYDALGRQLWTHTQQLMAGEQRLPINSRPLTPGLYRLRLTLADGRQRVLALVRQ